MSFLRRFTSTISRSDVTFKSENAASGRFKIFIGSCRVREDNKVQAKSIFGLYVCIHCTIWRLQHLFAAAYFYKEIFHLRLFIIVRSVNWLWTNNACFKCNRHISTGLLRINQHKSDRKIHSQQNNVDKLLNTPFRST